MATFTDLSTTTTTFTDEDRTPNFWCDSSYWCNSDFWCLGNGQPFDDQESSTSTFTDLESV